jgi:hypothetical protein
MNMFLSLMALAAGALVPAGLLSILITLIVVGLILWVCWWFIGYIGLPEPFNKVARVIIGLVALIFVVNLLLGLIGKPLF